MMGGYGGMMGMMGGYGGSMSTDPAGGGMTPSVMIGDTMGMMGGYGGMMGMMGGEDTGGYAKPDLMIRSLDFTVTPGTAYQYRVRIVVANPNKGLDNVRLGTDVASDELYGPWSGPTAAVRVPEDVTTFAAGVSPADPNVFNFQVASFDTKRGLTVVNRFDHKVGEFVGELRSCEVPQEDDKSQVIARAQIDFSTKLLLIDATGGPRSRKVIGKPEAVADSPVVAVLMRPDGMLLLRDQAHEQDVTAMQQMKSAYDDILDDVRFRWDHNQFQGTFEYRWLR